MASSRRSLQAFSKPQKKPLRRPGSPHSKQRILLPADDQAVSIPASVRSTARSLFGKEAPVDRQHPHNKPRRRPGSPHSKQRILLPPDDQAVSIPASVRSTARSLFGKEARC